MNRRRRASEQVLISVSGDMNNRQAVTLDRLWKCIKDYDLWPLYLIGLTTYIPPQPPTTYLSFILRQAGFSTFLANVLAIPSQFLFGVQVSRPDVACRRLDADISSASHCILGVGEAQRACPCVQHIEHLDPTLARCACSFGK